MNRFFTRSQLIEAYRLPQQLQDQLFGEVDPVEKNDQREALYLEAHIDAWITARYAVAPWRSGSGFASISTVPHIKPVDGEKCYVSVAEAQRRFLAGEMSRRWWYRMAKIGKIAHHRVGDSILFRTDDIEKFIADSRKAEPLKTPPTEMAPTMPVVVPPPVKHPPRRKSEDEDVGFQFFPR